jgi:hypothetical protein
MNRISREPQGTGLRWPRPQLVPRRKLVPRECRGVGSTHPQQLDPAL